MKDSVTLGLRGSSATGCGPKFMGDLGFGDAKLVELSLREAALLGARLGVIPFVDRSEDVEDFLRRAGVPDRSEVLEDFLRSVGVPDRNEVLEVFLSSVGVPDRD